MPPSTTPEVAAVVQIQKPPLRVLSDPPPTRATVPLGRSASDHTGLHDMLRYGNDGGERLGCTAAAAGSRDSWAARAALLVGGQRPGLAKAAVLASQCTGELTALDAALEALGTPMEGIPVEVASQLQQRIASKERDADQVVAEQLDVGADTVDGIKLALDVSCPRRCSSVVTKQDVPTFSATVSCRLTTCRSAESSNMQLISSPGGCPLTFHVAACSLNIENRW